MHIPIFTKNDILCANSIQEKSSKSEMHFSFFKLMLPKCKKWQEPKINELIILQKIRILSQPSY